MSVKFVPAGMAAGLAPSFKRGWSWDPHLGVLQNPKFAQVMLVAFERDGVLQNDQILRVESNPGCFIPLNTIGLIGLLHVAYRPQVCDVELHAELYPYSNPADLTSTIGRPSWELPRGYANMGESGGATAVREGEEETRSAIVANYVLGRTCGNTAIEPHYMTVVAGLVDPDKAPKSKPDPNEKLVRGLTFFSDYEIDDLIIRSELYCGITLSALRLLQALGGAKRVVADYLT